MILTFPQIGHSTVLLAVLFKSMGVEVLIPKEQSGTTVEKATRLAPEGACMPFKTVMGSFLESYERGADTGIFFGGCGPCAFGYFSTTMNRIFEANGIDFRVLTLEFGSDDLSELLNFVRENSGRKALSLIQYAPTGLLACRYLDRFENYMNDVRAEIASEENRKDFNRFEESCYKSFLNCESFTELNKRIYICMLKANSFRENRRSNIKIGIVGDIFSIIDSFSNYDIQRMLADMGVKTRRSMTLSGWFYEKIPFLPDIWKLWSKRYMKKNIGGFARETVGYTGMWSRKLDGVIQIFPLNCMPETAAAGILPQIHARTGVPILQLTVDEGTSEEGYRTRAEAFSEMIKRKKEAGEYNDRKIFSRG